MRLVDIWLVKRVDDMFYINGHKIPADRRASDGYGVLCVYAPSKLDVDFNSVLGYDYRYWFPKDKSLKMIYERMNMSDSMTCDWLREGKGWTTGPRPFKLEQFI